MRRWLSPRSLVRMLQEPERRAREDFLHWFKAAAPPRRRGTPRWGPALRAALARRPRAPHRTPRPRTRAAPRTSTRTLLSAQATITATALVTAGAGACLAAASPQPSPHTQLPSSDPFGALPYRHRSRTPPSRPSSRSLRRPACLGTA